MLSDSAMRELSLARSQATESGILARLGHPSRDEIVETAIAGLASQDRNVRVVMLRVLRGQSGPKAMQGVLAGLSDPKRRVREVAINSSGHYHMHPEIIDRLEAIAIDEHETRRIRSFALASLVGTLGSLGPAITAAHRQAVDSIARSDKYRGRILMALLHLDLTRQVESLLRDFVANGTREEAVMATRALCGFRVANLGEFGSTRVRKYVMHSCELAAGRVMYWVRREQYPDLLAGQVPESNPG